MNLDHVAVAVRDLDAALDAFRPLDEGFRQRLASRLLSEQAQARSRVAAPRDRRRRRRWAIAVPVGLALAAWHPRAVRSLVAVGARAGLADPEERRRRIADDEALADRIERLGLAWFVEHWMSLPLFASQQRLGREFLERARDQRLRNRPEALARSLRGLGVGAQPPLHDRLAAIACPTLIVHGERDAKFTAAARELAAHMPRAETCEHEATKNQCEFLVHIVTSVLGSV